MSDKETVIELRQLSSKQVFQNGDFENVIENNNLVIEEGDSLVLKKAVIDSVQTQAEEVLIDADTTARISFYRYFVNWKCKKEAIGTTHHLYDLEQADVSPDNKMYFEGRLTESNNPNLPNVFILNEIRLTKNIRLKAGIWGNCVITIQYTSISGDTQHYTANIPQLNCNDTLTYSVYPQLIFRDNTLIIPTSPSYLKDHGIENNILLVNQAYNAVKMFDLKTHTVTIDIPKGRYTCDEICNLINSQVDKSADNLENLTGASMNNTPLLGSTDTTDASHVLLSCGNIDLLQEQINPAVNIMSYKNDGTVPFQYTGTSDFSLAYDGNKFKIETMNSPYYTCKSATTANRGLTGVLYNLKGTGTDANAVKNVINKSSGIVFSALQPEELWYDKLGFDGSICPPISTGNITLGGQDYPAHIFVNALKDGIHTTGTAPTLDASIIKSVQESTDSIAYTFNCIPKNDISEDIEIQASGQIEIYASNTYNYSILKTYGGYMLLEIRLGVNQDYTGEQNHLKNVFGIITNYYRSNNYVVGTTEDGCIYNHVGNAVQINSIRVRLLNPNTLQPVPGLDQDNSIFLSLIKNQAPKQKPKQDKKE